MKIIYIKVLKKFSMKKNDIYKKIMKLVVPEDAKIFLRKINLKYLEFFRLYLKLKG